MGEITWIKQKLMDDDPFASIFENCLAEIKRKFDGEDAETLGSSLAEFVRWPQRYRPIEILACLGEWILDGDEKERELKAFTLMAIGEILKQLDRYIEEVREH